jgi:hypothetical protein
MLEEEEAQRKEEVAKEKARQKEDKDRERAEEADQKKKQKQKAALEREVRKETKKKATAERKRLSAAKRAQKEAAIAEKKRVRGLKQVVQAKKDRRKAKAVDTPDELEEDSVEDLEEEVANVLSEVESVEDEEAEAEEPNDEPNKDARRAGGQRLFVCAKLGPSVPQPQSRSQTRRHSAQHPISDGATEVEADAVHSAKTTVEGAMLKPHPRPCPIVKAPAVIPHPGRVTRSSLKKS